MNNKTIKNLFLISLHIAFSFSVNGMEFDLPIPRSPGATAVAAAPVHVSFPELTTEQIVELNEVVQLTWNMISKLRQRFAEKDLNITVSVPVKELQKKISGLLPLFERFFIMNRNRFTPQNKALLNKFEKSIEMLSPTSFVKGDSKTFEASVEMGRFPITLETHNESIAYVPDWFTESSFALFRKSETINIIAPDGNLTEEKKTGTYNLLHMLEGDNPESLSGIIEYHHLYQTNEYFTPLCFSYHKKSKKLLHKAKGKTRVDRKICDSDFRYTNKYVAGIQILKMIKTVFEHNEEVYDVPMLSSTEEMINAILRSPGNVDVIPNTYPVVSPSLSGELEAESEEHGYLPSLSPCTDGEFSRLSPDSRYSLESNSRDSITSSSFSGEQIERVSISSTATDGSFDVSLSDDASQRSTHRKKRNYSARKKADPEYPLIGTSSDKENQQINSPERKKKPGANKASS